MTNRTHLSDEIAQRHLEGLLGPGPAAEVEEHLASCAGCRALVRSHRLLAEALGGLATAEPPAGFTAGVLSRIEARERAAAFERRVALAILGSVVAAAAAFFAAAGPGAWASALSGGSESLAQATSALRIGADVAGPLVRALRAEIALACAAASLPLLIVLKRLVPARRAETA